MRRRGGNYERTFYNMPQNHCQQVPHERTRIKFVEPTVKPLKSKAPRVELTFYDTAYNMQIIESKTNENKRTANHKIIFLINRSDFLDLRFRSWVQSDNELQGDELTFYIANAFFHQKEQKRTVRQRSMPLMSGQEHEGRRWGRYELTVYDTTVHHKSNDREQRP